MHLPQPIHASAIALIKHHEALRLKPYLDPVGLPTIGWGHLILQDGKPLPKGVTGLEIAKGIYPNGISKNEALRLLTEDISDAAWAVNKYVKVELSPYQFGALVSFVFNFGETKFRKSTYLKKINKRDWRGAMRELKRWKHGRVKGRLRALPGLIARRADEAELFMRGLS